MADPPRPPLRAAPTLSTVVSLLESCLGQLKGARLDIDGLRSDVEEIRRHAAQEIIRVATNRAEAEQAEEPSEPTTPARPSIAAKAAHGTAAVGKYTAYIVAGLTVAAQIVAAVLPHQQGPIVELLRVALAAFKGAQP